MTVWPDMKRATAPGPDRAEPVEAPREAKVATTDPVPPVDPARSEAPSENSGRLDIATLPANASGAPGTRRLRRRLGLVAALVLSAAAHAALIGYLAEHLRPEGIEAATDAVSVELLFETDLAMMEPSASAQAQAAVRPESPPAATPVEAEPSELVETAIDMPPVEPDPAQAVSTEPDQPSADPPFTPIEPESAETLSDVVPDPADAITEPEIAEEAFSPEVEDTPQASVAIAQPAPEPSTGNAGDTQPSVPVETGRQTPPVEPAPAQAVSSAQQVPTPAAPLEHVEPGSLEPVPVEPIMEAAPTQPSIEEPAPEPIATVEAVEPEPAAAPPLAAQTPPDTVMEPETPVEASAAEPTPPEASAEATSPLIEPDRAPTTSPETEISGSSTTATVPALPEIAPLPVEAPVEPPVVEAIPVEPDLHLPERMALLPSARPAPPAPRAERAAAPAPRQQRASRGETREPARSQPSPRRAASAPPAASTARESRRPAARSPAAAPSRAASAGEQERYARRLARHVERYKRYPAAAARQRITGVTRIAITINRSGGLVGARVASASGHAVLDGEAVAIARRAAPYPRPPENVGDRNFSFTVALRFAR